MKRLTSSILALGITSQMLLVKAAVADAFTSCLQQNNKNAVVKIKYSYTDDGGSDSEQGTGFIISPSGFILTASHVVHPRSSNGSIKTSSIKVRFENSLVPEQDGSMVDENTRLDVALLAIKPNDPPWATVPIGHSSDLKVGDDVGGLGYPKDAALTMIGPASIGSSGAVVSGELKPSWMQTGLDSGQGRKW